jgi:hypothetical protein
MRWWYAGLGVVTLACDGDSGLDQGATTGTIQVITSIEGSVLDHDGYTLRFDGGSEAPLAVSDTVVFAGVAAGDHVLELVSISPECRVQGSNPRTVNVSAGGAAYTVFAVVCGQSGTGRLTVSTFTYGTRPDFYVVEVTGGPSAAVGPEDQVTLFGVPAGVDTVTLTLVPSECLAFANPRVIPMPEGAQRQTLFKIRCPPLVPEQPPPPPGQLGAPPAG